MMTTSTAGHKPPDVGRQPVRAPLAAALVVCLSLGASCSDHRPRAPIDDSGPPVRGGTLEVVGSTDVDHLATTSGYTFKATWLARAYTRQLVSYPAAADFATKTTPAADLATEVPTQANGGIAADGLTYTFHLRRGVRWDSTPPREVTAHDVVRAFKLLCNPVNPVGAPGYYTDTIVGMAAYCEAFGSTSTTVAAIRAFVETHDLEGVRAADDFTVVFRLRAPATDFLNLVAMPFASAVPADYLDYLPDSPEFRQHTRSCGPYRIVSYLQEREIAMDRNPAWDPATDPIRQAHVDRIRIRLHFDQQQQQLQIEAGTVDIGFGEEVPASQKASLLAAADSLAWACPPGDAFARIVYLAVNLVGPNNRGALKHQSVRRAVALAVDKAGIVQVAGGPRLASPLRQPVATGAAGHSQDADRNVTPGDRGDPAAARALLAAAGYPRGISLRLVHPITTFSSLTCQVLQASLQRAGIQASIVPSTMSDYYNRLLAYPDLARRGEWDLALADWTVDWFGEGNGRTAVAAVLDGRHFVKNTQNYGGYDNPNVDALIDRALTVSQLEPAREAWNEAVRLASDDVAIVPLIEQKVVYARSRRVRGCTWSVMGMNCDPTALWLDQR